MLIDRNTLISLQDQWQFNLNYYFLDQSIGYVPQLGHFGAATEAVYSNWNESVIGGEFSFIIAGASK
jgi:hypothetical protein